MEPYFCCNCHQRFNLAALMTHLREAHGVRRDVLTGYPLADNHWRYTVYLPVGGVMDVEECRGG